jgi:allantoin racemase
MKILLLSPFGATEPNAGENLRARARTGTEVHVECLEDVFPLPYNTYHYNLTKVIDGTVERSIRAEAEGYDAIVISCMLDPGLVQARGVVNIPVVGTMEATAHVASMIGNRFAVINADATVCAQMERLIAFYGLREKVACLRHIDIVSCDLYPEKTPTEEVFRRVKEQAEKAIREDGAEVIIAGCTIIGGLLTQHHGEDPGTFLEGVPVLDGMVVGFKTAELMVDLVQLGYPAVSRLGFWKKPPTEETAGLRKWYTTHESPFKYNWDRMP